MNNRRNLVIALDADSFTASLWAKPSFYQLGY
jgi:hypothetical protein